VGSVTGFLTDILTDFEVHLDLGVRRSYDSNATV